MHIILNTLILVYFASTFLAKYAKIILVGSPEYMYNIHYAFIVYE